MNLVYASMYLYLPQFLYSVFYSFPSTGLLTPWLNLFLQTLFFCCYYSKWDFFFSDSFSDSSFLVWKNALISEYWLCILLVCWIHLFSLLVFWWSLYSFLCKLSCHLQIMIALLPLFQFGCLLFLLVWSLSLGLLVLCWVRVVKVDTLVLFLILREMILVFAHWVRCWQ